MRTPSQSYKKAYHKNDDLQPSPFTLPSLAYTIGSQDIAQRTNIPPILYETGSEAQTGHEGDDACWLEAALRHEAIIDEEGLRATFARSDSHPLDLTSPTIFFQYEVLFNTEDQFTYDL